MFLFDIWRAIFYTVKVVANAINGFVTGFVETAITAHKATLGILTPLS